MRYYTPPELADMLRVKPATVRAWIRSGELSAFNVAQRSARRPRFRISSEALAQFEARRNAKPLPIPNRRRRRTRESNFPEFD